jgi:hypothetical protein
VTARKGRGRSAAKVLDMVWRFFGHVREGISPDVGLVNLRIAFYDAFHGVY